MLKLSRRLQALADLVPQGMRVADIGTDHALLPCYLIEQEISPFVIAVEFHDGPYRAAYKNIQENGLTGVVDLRKGDGLSPLAAGEADAVIIAGMGGGTIRDILSRSPRIIKELKRLILQPMTDSQLIRPWLQENGWRFLAEDLVYEDGRIFEIMALEKGQYRSLTAAEAAFGPLLIKNRHPLLPKLLQKELAGLQEILNQLAKSKNMEALIRSRHFKERVKMVKELLEWLSVAVQ